MATTIERALVLDVFHKQNNEFVITFFNQKGAFSLFALGLNKPASKNRSNLLQGCIVEIEYFKARLPRKMGKLKTAHLIETIDYSKFNANDMFLNLSRLWQRIKQPNRVYQLFVRYIKLLDAKNKWKMLTYFYANSLEYFGVHLDFQGCALCFSRQSLIDFDLNQGGFICFNHTTGPNHKNPLVEYIWASFNDIRTYFEINLTDNFDILNIYQKAINDYIKITEVFD
ncbi:DNA repair protein RecO [Mycoplasma nasistruthionis]|uniref:DNA repair protein RecO n=1 Tax=Mycoplasma nasistruthionis TaxID=353852 RepID=A0A5B7XVS6_9MOLU|nr:DNA repair protein RecO [Mycoplasma nasistruthionis]QCZ36968.1 DNA repair protein RecO [Mycoplasma nasistruthionis]